MFREACRGLEKEVDLVAEVAERELDDLDAAFRAAAEVGVQRRPSMVGEDTLEIALEAPCRVH
jgi:hypothetical protein